MPTCIVIYNFTCTCMCVFVLFEHVLCVCVLLINDLINDNVICIIMYNTAYKKSLFYNVQCMCHVQLFVHTCYCFVP